MLISIGTAIAQNRTVEGVVTSTEDGEPVIGASILVKGTSQGTVTNLEGRFTLSNVPASATHLVISYVGMQTQEVSITTGTMHISMKGDSELLNEVVVVAYGTQKKSSVTGSMAVIKESQLKTVTSPNINNMLQGKVAGVQVLSNTGKPGNAAQIRIRGKGSIGSSLDPLWVVDGVISAVGAQLNPNEIASISVLKDAAATALYGSRASNGVIIVTTKSGNTAESSLEVSAKVGVAVPNFGKLKMMDSQQLYDYTASMAGLSTSGVGTWFNEELLKHNTNWADIATQNAMSQNYNISYTSGANGKFRSFLMADYYNEDGTVKGYDYTRYNVRSNVDYIVNKYLTIKTKLSGSYMGYKDQQYDLYSSFTYLPWDYPYNEDGSVRTGKESTWHGRDASNYLHDIDKNWSRGKAFGATASIGFDLRFTDWLVFESNNNLSVRYTLDESYVDPTSIGAEEYSGSISNKNNLYITRYTNQLLRFNKTFADKHDVSAFLGYEFSDSHSHGSEASGRGIPQGGEVFAVASKPYSVGGTIREWAVQSVFFNANYTYDERYMGQISYRMDQSSRFGANKRTGNFFTVGAGWTVSNEAFMKPYADWLTQLKLRGSWGSIGNMPDSNYGYLSTYSLSINYNGVPAAFPNRLGNPNLTWEKCYETNIALDLRLFDRVSLSAEWYDKNTSGLLYNVTLSAITGYTNQWQNVGAIRNTGMEFTLSPDIIKTRDFLWTADFNIGFNKAMVKELYQGAPQIIGSDMGGQKIREEGRALDTWYLKEWAGVDVYTGDPMWYIYNEDGSRTLTNDISKATRTYMGTSNPKFSGGLVTTASWKGLSLQAGLSFVSGNKVYNYARQYYDNDGAYPTYNSMVLADGWSRWEKPGDIATHPRAVVNGNRSSNMASSRYLEDGSFLKINNITLSYDLPRKWLAPASIKALTVSFAAENIATFTKFSCSDPEVSTGANDGTADTGQAYAPPRRFSLGVNLKF
ncbi:MAG: TonB-dependent receptor [Prevotellaceae bacterium]|nr:TonB-dependent receptor [Prevotellaceae bacterium]